jgi:hypothetical protein
MSRSRRLGKIISKKAVSYQLSAISFQLDRLQSLVLAES